MQCRLGRGLCQRLLFIHYTFMCLMAVTWQVVLVDCQKSWTTWSLVNGLIHSSDVDSTRKDVIEAGDLVRKLIAMTLIIKELKTNILEENILVKQTLSLQSVGQLSNTTSKLTVSLAWGWATTIREWFQQTRWEIPCYFHRTSCCLSESILL